MGYRCQVEAFSTEGPLRDVDAVGWDACDVTPGPRMETSIQFVRRVRTRVWIEILRWRYDAIGTTT